MFNRLISKNASLAVVGLDYMGLPLALELARNMNVIGYDYDKDLVGEYRKKNDPRGSVLPESFGGDIVFTSDEADLADADFYIITVPTTTDCHKKPDLTELLYTTSAVGRHLQAGNYVVFESAVYPGCTQEDLIPILEEESGLRCIKDFKVGYSPCRTASVEPIFSLQHTVKVVSACDGETMENVSKVYSLVTKAGVHQAPTMRIAEASALLENVQLDLNVALMNEFSVVCQRMGMNTHDVIRAASTNPEFKCVYPTLVGGERLTSSPYQLLYSADEMNYHFQTIRAARSVNDAMGEYVARQTVKKLLSYDMPLLRARILVLGVSNKADSSDFFNSRVVNIVRELISYRIAVDVVDPLVDPVQLDEMYGLKLTPHAHGKYNAILVAVPHHEFMNMTEEDFIDLMDPTGLIVDVDGVFRDRINELRYWSL